jgi:Retrotransposon gag protein
MGFHVHKFSGDVEKVLWATSFLRGRAFDWIETFVSDYLKNVSDPSEMEQETRAIFGTWEGYKGRISRVFGDIDAERTAARHIRALRQRGLANTYAAEF